MTPIIPDEKNFVLAVEIIISERPFSIGFELMVEE